MTTGVLLLAAGSSRRFGSDKRHVLLADGRTMLDTVIGNIQDSELPLRVCLAAGDDSLADDLAQRGIETMCCSRASEGMGGTLAQAAAALPAWDAVLVALADMPLIQPQTYARVAASAQRDRICVPCSEGVQGHPVAFGADFFCELILCCKDKGARWVIDRYQPSVDRLALDDPGILVDIDSQDTLARHIGT